MTRNEGSALLLMWPTGITPILEHQAVYSSVPKDNSPFLSLLYVLGSLLISLSDIAKE